MDTKALQQLIDKEAIRDLVHCYSRAIDRKDFALLRDLYTEDGTDTHGDSYDGSAAGFYAFIEGSVPHLIYSGHHICNHMISVDGDEATGEVYLLALHVMPGGISDDERIEDIRAVRYLDNYRRCADGNWRFSKRVVPYDMIMRRIFTGDGMMGPAETDPSYEVCKARLFQRGARAPVNEAVPAE